jgi:cyanophycin synthetase
MGLRRFSSRWYWIRLGRKLNIRLVRWPLLALRAQPLVAITGTNGKTSTTLLINRILREAGYHTGCSSTEGILIDDQWVARGDEAGARGLWIASRPRHVQALVAETARGGILRYGVGFPSCHVSVVTNVAADHLGQLGVESVKDLAEVKSILPKRTRRDGVAVLNGDQPLVRDMAKKSRARAVYFTLNEPLASWEHCYFVRDGAIHRRRGDKVERLVEVDNIYAAHGGAVTFQVANAMAATAAIEGLQPWLRVQRESLVSALANFGRNPRDIPGRTQLFRYAGADVLLSSAKNPDTYEREISVLRRLIRGHGYQRVVCIVSEVGNRTETHVRGVSQNVARIADVMVCVPPHDQFLRGKTPDDIVRLLETDVPAEKLAHVSATSLPRIIAELEWPDAPLTLFVVFASDVCSVVDVNDVMERGDMLPMRFAP